VTLRKGADDLLKWSTAFIFYIKNNNEHDVIKRECTRSSLNSLPTFRARPDQAKTMRPRGKARPFFCRAAAGFGRCRIRGYVGIYL